MPLLGLFVEACVHPAITLSNLLAPVGPSLGDESLSALWEFSPGAMIWTWAAFLLGLLVMWKYVYGPITTALEARDKKVEDAILAAEGARREAEAQMARAKTELEKAQADSKRCVEEAMARAERQGAGGGRGAAA